MWDNTDRYPHVATRCIRRYLDLERLDLVAAASGRVAAGRGWKLCGFRRQQRSAADVRRADPVSRAPNDLPHRDLAMDRLHVGAAHHPEHTAGRQLHNDLRRNT